MAFDTDNQRLFAASSVFAIPLADMLAAPPAIIARAYPYTYSPPPAPPVIEIPYYNANTRVRPGFALFTFPPQRFPPPYVTTR